MFGTARKSILFSVCFLKFGSSLDTIDRSGSIHSKMVKSTSLSCAFTHCSILRTCSFAKGGKFDNTCNRSTPLATKPLTRYFTRTKPHTVKCMIQKGSTTSTTKLQTLSSGASLEIIYKAPKQLKNDEAMSLPPLVFIHGTKHAAWAYKNYQTYFSDLGYETYSVSMRGYGNSKVHDTSCKSFSIDDCVNDLTELWKECDFEKRKPIVMGHSLGGYFVQRWICSPSFNSNSISGFCLLCSMPPSGNSDLVRRVLFKLGPFMSWDITRALVTKAPTKEVKLCRKIFFTDKDSDEELMNLMPLLKQNLKVNARTITPITADNISSDFDCPMLAMGGTNDVIVDEQAVEEAAEFWDGDTLLIEGAPHDIMLYHGWETSAKFINRWVEEKVLI